MFDFFFNFSLFKTDNENEAIIFISLKFIDKSITLVYTQLKPKPLALLIKHFQLLNDCYNYSLCLKVIGKNMLASVVEETLIGRVLAYYATCSCPGSVVTQLENFLLLK